MKPILTILVLGTGLLHFEISAPLLAEQSAETRRQSAGSALLGQVDSAWSIPRTSGEPARPDVQTAPYPELERKLDEIVIPVVNFNAVGLGSVASTLSQISMEFDPGPAPASGVNIVVLNPGNKEPTISLNLRHVSLRRLLDFVAGAAGFVYEVQQDAVVLRSAGGEVVLETRFHPVSRATVLRMTGRSPDKAVIGAEPPLTDTGAEGRAIRTFLQLAGVDFEGTPGASLAFDGSQIIVTQTPRSLQRIANILARYRELRQVEIEAKFMEVQQGALEEIGVQWNATNHAAAASYNQAKFGTIDGGTRTLSEAFRNSVSNQQISITGDGQPAGGLNLPAAAPSMPGGVMLAAGAGPLADFSASIGEFDVNAVVRALAQKSGTELLSAPKLTVLSGSAATITVAQEMRYPQSYGQIQSQVGTGSISGGGSAGVSITSGTPQEFTTRNIGVELRVMPTVEEDNHSISLELNPKVTEFEGFVEYGGPSVAISGGTTVTVPPGFYQPIFAVREVSTRVTLWDGATLILGGLTREDVKKVSDKVPILGSVPIIGRLFRTKGESTQKRNLLIFVTANLVNPGGAPVRRAEPTEPTGELK